MREIVAPHHITGVPLRGAVQLIRQPQRDQVFGGAFGIDAGQKITQRRSGLEATLGLGQRRCRQGKHDGKEKQEAGHGTREDNSQISVNFR